MNAQLSPALEFASEAAGIISPNSQPAFQPPQRMSATHSQWRQDEQESRSLASRITEAFLTATLSAAANLVLVSYSDRDWFGNTPRSHIWIQTTPLGQRMSLARARAIAFETLRTIESDLAREREAEVRNLTALWGEE